MSDSFLAHWNTLLPGYTYGLTSLVAPFSFFFCECVCVCLDHILFRDAWDKYDFPTFKKNVLEISKQKLWNMREWHHAFFASCRFAKKYSGSVENTIVFK